jgi:predicted NAD/FAD-dependent oxidoreductase
MHGEESEIVVLHGHGALGVVVIVSEYEEGMYGKKFEQGHGTPGHVARRRLANHNTHTAAGAQHYMLSITNRAKSDGSSFH